MLFPTISFAIFFLIVFFGHWLLVQRGTPWKIFILAASWFFYAYFDWHFLGLLILYTVVNYYLSVATFRSGNPPKRRWVVLAIFFNLALLGFFKYYNFFIINIYQVCHWIHVPCTLPILSIALPIGISFFTFQAMSYVVDVHRGILEPAQSLLDFAVYKAFFPQLVAGPIIRAAHYLPQFYHIRNVSRLDVGRAATLILGGLFKKVVIANYVAVHVVDPVFENPGIYGGPDSLLAIYGYAVQLYCDFSAYSDIAIGAAQLLGFNFPENFNAPYFATSVREYWQRWHISLSTWLRDYLFFSIYALPLGGMRYSTGRMFFSICVTFLLGGLWHGPSWTFVLWGAMQGVYISGEHLLGSLMVWLRGGKQLPDGPIIRFWQRTAVIHLQCASHAVFRSTSLADAALLFQRLASSWHTVTLFTVPAVLVIIIGFLTQLMDGTRLERVWDWYNRLSAVWQGLVAAIVLTVILALGPRGVAPFIYFQF